MTDINAQIKTLIADELEVNRELVTDDARFAEDLNADSLDTVELVMSLEEHFNISIEDEAAEAMVTVADVINYIRERKGQ